MKLLALILGTFGAVLFGQPLLVVSPALADSRTPPEATQHALDELANICAQRRPECPPTLTPTPTRTLTPTSTSTPVPPSAATEALTATPTPEPCWLTDQDLGDPDNGYIVFGQDGNPMPCPVDQVADEQPTPEPTSTPSSTPTPKPAPLPPAPPAPQVQVVVQTVVVMVTAIPAAAITPLPTPTVALTSTPTPTASPTATRTSTTTAVRAATATPAAIAADANSAGGVLPAVDWWALGKVLGSTVALLAVVGITVAIKRRTVVRKPGPPRGDAYA